MRDIGAGGVVEGFLEALQDASRAVRHGVLRSRQCRAMAAVKDLKPAISWSVSLACSHFDRELLVKKGLIPAPCRA
jgi:hypothetical protein